MRRSVVLPAPFGPKSPNISPLFISKVVGNTALISPLFVDILRRTGATLILTMDELQQAEMTIDIDGSKELGALRYIINTPAFDRNTSVRGELPIATFPEGVLEKAREFLKTLGANYDHRCSETRSHLRDIYFLGLGGRPFAKDLMRSGVPNYGWYFLFIFWLGLISVVLDKGMGDPGAVFIFNAIAGPLMPLLAA